ncbi:MAG: RecX family transcriptional regulator [Chloroflexi bacterium]|nr:RecX family transcriptional regulator [Chloroflexota bacterium]
MPRFRRLRPSEPARVLETDASLAVQRGLALIAQRPRTDADLRDRLADRFDEAAVEAAVARLAELGYVDDAAWAAGYVARTRSTERSARMLRTELREHGVEAETAAEALLVHDDDAAALAAAQRLARSRRGRPPDARDRRLHAALARRGFARDTIERALSRLQEEAAATRA